MFAIRDVIRGNYCNAMFIKRQAQELRFMTQQKLHSVRSTGTATAILMSPDPPVLRAKVWLARLLLYMYKPVARTMPECSHFGDIYLYYDEAILQRKTT